MKYSTAEARNATFGRYSLAMARITLGLIFLQQFLDKTLGLGGTTCRNMDTHIIVQGCREAWMYGGSPSLYFLHNNAAGPLISWMQVLAGNALTDWIFMGVLLLMALSLIFGVALRLGAIAGSTVLLFLWLVSFQPANPPYVHIPLIFFMLGVAFLDKEQRLSLGRWWQKLPVVSRITWLQ